jgi:hypothetical protein
MRRIVKYEIAHVTHYSYYIAKFFFWRNSPQWARASSFTRFLDYTQAHHTR